MDQIVEIFRKGAPYLGHMVFIPSQSRQHTKNGAEIKATRLHNANLMTQVIFAVFKDCTSI